MISITNAKGFPQGFGPTAVTIGKFDGIHLGHQQLLAETLESAEEHSLLPTVVTFDRHPTSVLNPGAEPDRLIGPKQKQFLLQEAGIELVLNLPFDDVLSSLSAKDFVSQILVDQLKAKIVIIGEGFRFGASQQGDVALLKSLGQELGFMVKVIPSIEVDGQPVSTSRIRELLQKGNVSSATKLLGRMHATTGIIEHGLKIGREIGFPTANMSRSAEGFLPADGVYAGWLYSDGERYMAALSVGKNETFESVPKVLEAHVIDAQGLDLYDKIVTCEYVEFIRPAMKFDGVESLIAEINIDIEKIKVILA